MTDAFFPAIVALNTPGLATARRLCAALGAGRIHASRAIATADDTPFDDATSHIRTLFASGAPLVGICASGILIRALAPVLANKYDDAPVVAISIDGTIAVPLLGGHRGANRLATIIAKALGGTAAVTTAGDTALGFALDDPPTGWRIEPDSDVKSITSALLNDEPVTLQVDAGDAAWLGTAIDWQDDADLTLVLSDKQSATGDVTLRPGTLVMGLGCERNADTAQTIALAEATLAGMDFSPASLACIASIDLKADEPAIRAVSAHFGVPLRLLDAATLEAETPRLANPSEIVFKAVGCHGVAEGAALAGAGPDACLSAPKQKSAAATCAIARAPDIVRAADIGRGLGKLTVVGIGPGTETWRTSAAAAALASARHLIGYGLYLDLLGPLQTHATRHDFLLGAETERARAALDLASKGEPTALVCSGDAGIYGMASLVFELLDHHPDPAWKFVDVQVEPGITAMQAAAARAGAPLGHDFCAISLSDLLTPWPVIERKLEAAGDGDFVISLYNPAGRKRRAPLERALEILRARRNPDCPVIIARSLGRDEEDVQVETLATLDPDSIDMLSILIIGNSETRQAARAGRSFTYTPRGYSRKEEGAA